MKLYKYRIFDLLSQTYYLGEFYTCVFYSLSEVAYLVDQLQKSCVEENRYEVHAIKLADIQTLE